MARDKVCRNPPSPLKKGVICTGKKFYSHPLLYSYKETELSEELNYRMGRVFRDYRRYLKQAKESLPPRDYMVELDVQTNTKELENNLKLKG